MSGDFRKPLFEGTATVKGKTVFVNCLHMHDAHTAICVDEDGNIINISTSKIKVQAPLPRVNKTVQEDQNRAKTVRSFLNK